MSKIRIRVANNEKITDTRTVIVERQLEDIQKQAKNKFNIKKKIAKIFNGKTGKELESNDQLIDLQQDDLLVLSTSKDKPFLGKIIASDDIDEL
jgi:ATP-dependent protease ClpP protease subunit